MATCDADVNALAGTWTDWLLQPCAVIAGTNSVNTTLVLFFMDNSPIEKDD